MYNNIIQLLLTSYYSPIEFYGKWICMTPTWASIEKTMNTM